jgi:hypothetical protein
LNRPAKLTGEARYYFGLPVASGSVRWRVTRTPRYFWWSFWWGRDNPAARAQTVASGVSVLKPDGSFDVAFTPAADERLGKDTKDLTYTYAVDADASDEGGETRSASHSFRLGFVSVEARVVEPPGFLLESRPGRFRISRSNLDGVARAGKGSWRIVALEQPPSPMLPGRPALRRRAAGPSGEGGAPRHRRSRGSRRGDGFHTRRRGLAPAGTPEYDPARMVRLWGQREILRGDVSTTREKRQWMSRVSGRGHRLHYRTVDEFGAVEMPL